MIIDVDDVAEGTTVPADVCVVGAGAAGITLARRLADHGRDVLLLEGGGEAFEDASQDLMAGATTGEPMRFGETTPDLAFGRLRMLGGTTGHWGGWCHPLEPTDLERRSHVEHSGWPFGIDELESHYRDAQAVCELGPSRYDAAWWQSQGAGSPVLDTALLRTRVFQLSPPTRFGERYRADLARSERITTVLHANVVDLLLDEGTDRIGTVRVAGLGGRRWSVAPRDVVLASGGIETPRLLLACRGQRPAGLGNQHDLVGRFFAEHPHANLDAVLRTPPDLLGLYALAERRGPGLERPVRTASAIGPSARTADVLGLNGFVAVVLPRFVRPDVEPGAPAEVLSRGGALAAFEATTGQGGSAALLELRFEQSPNPASRVLLGSELDPLGLPRAVLDWRLGEDDRARMRRSVALLAREMAAAGTGWLRVEHDGEGMLERRLGVGFHHMGTTRMHASSRQGVVDADGLVHGVANLHVTGAATFPTPGWANPTLTVVALALRLADHLRRRR